MAPPTYGWILGELIQRTDGRDSKTFIREQITQPHGLDVHAGVDPQHHSRIAHFEYAQGRIGDSYDQALRRAMKSEPEHVAALSFSNPSISPSLTSSPTGGGTTNRALTVTVPPAGLPGSTVHFWPVS